MIVFSIFGNWASVNLFKHDVLISNFIKRKDIKNIPKLKIQSLAVSQESYYERINIPYFCQFFESYYGPLLGCCISSISKRQKMVERANSQFENELDIHQLLPQFRSLKILMKNLLTDNQKKQLKYSQNEVIRSQSTTSSDSPDIDKNNIQINFDNIEEINFL